MQAVILAAGRGTRMGALTENIPKPMLLLSGKPLLEWKLEMLPDEIDEVICIVGYRRNQIEKYFGENWKGRKMTYVVQEELDGTGGALALTKGIVHGRFLVIMGDDLYVQKDLEDMLSQNWSMLAQHVDKDAFLYGVVETTKEGNVSQVIEKPAGRQEGLVSVNAFVLNEKFFDYELVRYSPTEYGLPQTVAKISADIPVKVITATAWQPVGRPEDISLGEAFLKKYWL